MTRTVADWDGIDLSQQPANVSERDWSMVLAYVRDRQPAASIAALHGISRGHTYAVIKRARRQIRRNERAARQARQEREERESRRLTPHDLHRLKTLVEYGPESQLRDVGHELLSTVERLTAENERLRQRLDEAERGWDTDHTSAEALAFVIQQQKERDA